MKLVSLQLLNVRQHAQTFVEFPSTGIIGIVGANESGKSTILEAVTWALFGSRALRGSKASLRWNRAPARRTASAVLIFEVGGHTYQLTRSESTANLVELTADGRIGIADGTSPVDAHVPQLLGMSLEEFSATYLCAQRDLGRLASMGPTDRQAFIRGVMGLDRIDDGLRACRARKNDLQRELTGLQAGLGDRVPLQAEADEAAEAVALAEMAAADASQLVTLREEAASTAAAAQEASERIRVRHETLSRARDQHLTEKAGLEREIARLRAELEPIAALPAKIAAAEKGAKSVESLRTELAQLHAQRDRVRERERLETLRGDRQRSYDEARDHIRDAQFQIDSFDTAAYAKATEDLAAEEVMLDDARTSREATRAALLAQSEVAGKEANLTQRRIEAIDAAGKDGACPTCLRALGEQIAAVRVGLVAHRDAQLKIEAELCRTAEALCGQGDDEKVLAARVAKLRAAVESGRVAQADAKKARDVIARWLPIEATAGEELTKLEAQLADLETAFFDAEHAARIEIEIAIVEAVNNDLARDRAAAERIPALERGIETTRRTLERLNVRIEEIDEGITALGFNAEQQSAATLAAAETRQQLEAARIIAARAESTVAAARATEQRAAAALATYDNRAQSASKIERELRIHAAAAERLDAFRVQQASLIRPELEELTTGFVHILTDGRHDAVTIGEDFDVTLHESGLAAEVVSGGTEDVAAIALRLAISQMVAQRAGHQLSLLVLDEPFGSLDEVRRANVLNLIRRLGRTFEQVLVISHVAETKDAVDHVIEVEYDEAAGASRVRCAALPHPVDEPLVAAVA